MQPYEGQSSSGAGTGGLSVGATPSEAAAFVAAVTSESEGAGYGSDDVEGDGSEPMPEAMPMDEPEMASPEPEAEMPAGEPASEVASPEPEVPLAPAMEMEDAEEPEVMEGRVGASERMKALLPLLEGPDPDTASVIEELRVEAFVPTGTGETFYVSPDGDDANLGTEDQPWKTIGHAVSEASEVGAGDTILVKGGTYTEIVDLEKSGSAEDGHIVLKADGEVVLRDPDPSDTGGVSWHEGNIQSVGQGYWVIDGFRIEDTSFAGISLRDANDMVVQNNTTFETGGPGIIVMPDAFFEGGEAEVTSRDITVLNNTIERSNVLWEGRGDPRGDQESITIWGVDGFEVAGNVVDGPSREGIDAKTGSRDGSIHDNFVTNAAVVSGTPGGYQGGPAIYVDGNRAESFDIDIHDNVVFDNVADGIVIADEAPDSGGGVRDVRVFDNLVFGNGQEGMNGGVGIGVGSNVAGVEIANNTMVDNVQAFLVDGGDFFGGAPPSDIVLSDNEFTESTYRNGFVGLAQDVTLENNVVSPEFEEPFEEGEGVTGLRISGNTTDGERPALPGGTEMPPEGSALETSEPADTGTSIPIEVAGDDGPSAPPEEPEPQPGEPMQALAVEELREGVRRIVIDDDEEGLLTISDFDLNSTGSERSFDILELRYDGTSREASTDAEMIALVRRLETDGALETDAIRVDDDLAFRVADGGLVVLEGIAGQLDADALRDAGVDVEDRLDLFG